MPTCPAPVSILAATGPNVVTDTTATAIRPAAMAPKRATAITSLATALRVGRIRKANASTLRPLPPSVCR